MRERSQTEEHDRLISIINRLEQSEISHVEARAEPETLPASEAADEEKISSNANIEESTLGTADKSIEAVQEEADRPVEESAPSIETAAYPLGRDVTEQATDLGVSEVEASDESMRPDLEIGTPLESNEVLEPVGFELEAGIPEEEAVEQLDPVEIAPIRHSSISGIGQEIASILESEEETQEPGAEENEAVAPEVTLNVKDETPVTTRMEVEHEETVDEQQVVDAGRDQAPEELILDQELSEAEEPLPQLAPLENVLEALAFAAEEPIPLKKVGRIFAELQGKKMPNEKKMLAVIESLNAQYEAAGRTFRIKLWGGGIRMVSHPGYAHFIRALYEDHRPKKLSRTLMETLAIIAYSQPTTKPEVDFVRGVDSDYAVRKLLELGLIDIVGRSEAIGRPLLYGTSERFLEQFGLSELEGLPKLKEVEELLGDPAFKKERLHLLALEGMDEAVAKSEEADEPTGEEPARPKTSSTEESAPSGDEAP